MDDRHKLEEIVRALCAARDNRDLDALMGYVDADCSFRIVGGPSLGEISQRSCGLDPIRCALQSLIDLWDTTGFVIDTINVDGDVAFVHRSGTVRFIPGGVDVETELVDKFTFRNGLVIDMVEFVDTLTMAETVGIANAAE